MPLAASPLQVSLMSLGRGMGGRVVKKQHSIHRRLGKHQGLSVWVVNREFRKAAGFRIYVQVCWGN